MRRARTALSGRYRSVLILSVVVALNSFGMGVIAPVLPLFAQQEYAVNAAQVGIAVGLFGVGRLVTGVPAGYLSQLYGRRPVLALGAALNTLGAVMVALSFNFWWLTGWRFISGLGANAFITIGTIYLRDESTPETRGRILSTQELSILSGQILGPLLGGYLGTAFGLRIPLFTQAVLMAASLAVILFLLPESRWREQQTASRAAGPGRPPAGAPATTAAPGRAWVALRRLLSSPAFIFVGLFAVMIVANRQGARFSVMPLFGKAKGFGPDDLGLVAQPDPLPPVLCHYGVGLSVRPPGPQGPHPAVGGSDVRRHRRLRLGRQPLAAAAVRHPDGHRRGNGQPGRHRVFRRHCAAGLGGGDPGHFPQLCRAGHGVRGHGFRRRCRCGRLPVGIVA